jgi:hypothetical protein
MVTKRFPDFLDLIYDGSFRHILTEWRQKQAREASGMIRDFLLHQFSRGHKFQPRK